MDVPSNQIYEFESFRLEAAERRLLKDGEPVVLPSKAFDVLLALVENGGHLVDKETLYDRVWGDTIVEEANLAVQISSVRKALGNSGYISTVKGHGYRFEANVRVAEPPDEIVIERETFSRVTVEHESEPDRPVYDIRPEGTKARNILRFAIAGLAVAGSLGIAFAAWRSGVFADERSTVEQFRSGSIKRLTSTGKIGYAAAISPDGKLFAYSHLEGELQSLWVGHVGGGEPMRVRPAAEVNYLSIRFSPDGKSLYYTLSSEGLYRIPVFGGAPEKISDEIRRTFTFSPDGKRIAFVRNRAVDEPAVVIAAADGSEHTSVGIPPTKLGFAVHSAAWSPDGSAIMVAAATNENGSVYEVFEISLTDGSIRQVTSGNFTEIDTLTWIPNGSGLVAVSGGALWHVAYPSGKSERLINDLSIYGYQAGISASGSDLLAVQVQQFSNIWTAPAGNLEAACQITFGSLTRADGWSGIDWTADGKLIYTAVVGGGQTIWKMDPDGSNQVQLTPSGQRNFHLSLADDSRVIVFVSSQSGRYAVWRMNIDGGDIRQLTDDAVAAQPHISPDGKWVVYISHRESFGTLFRIPIDGGEPVKLTEKQMSWVRVSPDSKYIAGAYRGGDKTSLAIIPIEGGEPIKLFDVPRLANFRLGVRWDPDGKFIAYRDWANGIWKQNIDGGPPERIVGLPEEKIYSFGWSRDGKQFAYARGNEIRDVVLINSR